MKKIVLSFVLILFGCGDDPSPTTASVPSAANVAISHGGSPGCESSLSCFEPNTTAVARNGTVTWTNSTGALHALVGGPPGSPNNDLGTSGSGAIQGGQFFQFTFTVAGTVNYHCQIHPWAQGFVQVDNQ